MLAYTCRNHVSYTSVNFGTSQKSCYVLWKSCHAHLKILASYLVGNMFNQIIVQYSSLGPWSLHAFRHANFTLLDSILGPISVHIVNYTLKTKCTDKYQVSKF